MANGFARLEIINASTGSSAVGASAYFTRSCRRACMGGQLYSFTGKNDDLAYTAVLLPDGVSSVFLNGEYLWNQAEEADCTRDRKTGELRFKKNAQLARSMVLALPWDESMTTEQLIEMACRFAVQKFIKHGVAVEVSIHLYDSEFDPNNTDNADVQRKLEHIEHHGLEVVRINEGKPWPEIIGPHVLAILAPDGSETWRVWQPHAHLQISTRVLGADGFGKKARELNPGFSNVKGGHGCVCAQDHWERQWSDFQNAYFLEHGLDLEVDPFSVVPKKHRGKARSIEAQTNLTNEAKHAQAKDLLQEPEAVLAYLTAERSVFTERDLDRALHQHGIGGAEMEKLKAEVLEDAEILRLYDRARGEETDFFTTRSVRAQEHELLRQSERICKRKRGVSQRAQARALHGMSLDPEQIKAFHHCTQSNGLTLIQGGAGTGKSYTVAAVRRAYEVDGYRVIGAAPTNAVAADMRKDGFFQADTLHALLWRLDNKRERLNRKTVLIVDEAAMADAGIYARLLARIEEVGAKLVLVGDDRQLSSIQRGGIYTLLKGKFGAARLDTVRRQHEGWQQKASGDFAQGRIFEGLKAYHEQGHIHWAEDLEDARNALVQLWAQGVAARPDVNRFVYASTNAEVNALNVALRQVRIQAGEIKNGETFETVRGQLEIAIGDRVQFYASDKKVGIYSGTLASVKAINHHYLTVQFDDGKEVSFNAQKFDKFGHGYAGTIYRGQGKTQLEVLALYDHPFAWNARSAYVGMTRHRASVDLFVPKSLARNGSELASRMRLDNTATPALHFATSPEQARQGRIDKIRQFLSAKSAGVRDKAKQQLPPKPKVKSKKRIWFDVYPKAQKLYQAHERTKHARRDVEKTYASSGMLTRIWFWLTDKRKRARLHEERLAREFQRYVSHAGRKRRVVQVIRKQHKRAVAWEKQHREVHASRQAYEYVGKLAKALERADQEGWACIGINTEKSLVEALKPYLKAKRTKQGDGGDALMPFEPRFTSGMRSAKVSANAVDNENANQTWRPSVKA